MNRTLFAVALTAGNVLFFWGGPAGANDWEGLSIGVGGGYGMANTKSSLSPPELGDIFNITTNGEPSADGFFTLSAGYDRAVLDKLIIGGFVDYDFADINSRSTGSFFIPESGSFNIGNQLSLGGRLGYLVAPTTLFFSTFGYAHVEASDATMDLGFDKARGNLDSFNGYFVGGGVETLIGGGFSVKAEYRYTSLQSQSTDLRPDSDPSVAVVTTSIKPQIQTARVSLNYRFGNSEQGHADNSTPPVTSSWSGAYIGIGGGYGIADNKIGAAEEEVDSEAGHFGSDGGIISFTLGYDRQIAPKFVVGAFADADYTNLHYRSSINVDAGDSFNETIRNNFRNILMVGARIGYLAAPDTLLFVSAGYANAGLGDTNIAASINNDLVDSATIEGRRFSGGFAGGGVETRINNSLSLKAEYRYADFGSEQASATSTTIPDAEFLRTKFDPAIQMGRVSMNYRFGSPLEEAAPPLK
ncbi:outer membrane protein [Hyphomicrobium sp.]|jgi:outer membrane immunogenic protein|uniref:outer membrane protein n=1 Tax=Hyphomicrobium sp. TaxID=82 RepID=UPI003567952A